MSGKQLLQFKNKEIANRFFKDLEKEGIISIDCPYGTISPINNKTICVAVHGVNKTLTTQRAKKIAAALDMDFDGEEIFVVVMEHTVKIALLLGAKPPKQMSEEARLKLSERAKKMRSSKA